MGMKSYNCATGEIVEEAITSKDGLVVKKKERTKSKRQLTMKDNPFFKKFNQKGKIK